jgi:hypothetical protein
VQDRITGAKRVVLAFFIRIERPAAWLLLAGALITLVGVLVGVIVVGEFKWPAVLLAASLVVDGLGAVQESEPELGDSGNDEPDA